MIYDDLENMSRQTVEHTLGLLYDSSVQLMGWWPNLIPVSKILANNVGYQTKLQLQTWPSTLKLLND